MADWYYRNLIPGQMQIGNIVMGRGTNIIIEGVNHNPHDVNNQDYQVSRADEIRFGFDQFKPTTTELTLSVLHNRLLEGFEGTIPNFWHSNPTIEDLAREWRGDGVRQVWGQMKPLYVRSKYDEKHKVVYGRPGQFAYTADDMYNHGEVVHVTAEFRRGDTLAYSLDQYAITLDQSDLSKQIIGTGGTGPSWLRVFLAGPIDHPILTFTNMFLSPSPVVIDLDYNVAADEIVEINAEPWSRRVVNNDDPSLNLAAKLIGATPFLDKLRFDFNSVVDVTLAGTGITSATAALILWRDSYQVI